MIKGLLASLICCFLVSFVHSRVEPEFSSASQRPFSSSTNDTVSTYTLNAFPKHAIRIRQVDFCDATVRAFTGYFDFQGRHMFFYYFESRNEPSQDPVIVWETGGPGGSSTIGMLTELGPCLMANSSSVKWNPYGWNSQANILFIDQPIGVGYSYSEYSEVVNSNEAAIDMARCLAIFFESTDFGLQGRELHIAGESYGGRYVPLLAARIYDQNAELLQEGISPINLASVLIGNGASDWGSLYPSYWDMQCTNASGNAPVQSIENCVQIKRTIPLCEEQYKSNCYDRFDQIGCQAAADFCGTNLVNTYFALGYSPYDITKKCDASQGAYCYQEDGWVDEYLNLPSIRKTLGIDPEFQGNFSVVSMDVNQAFTRSGDILHSSAMYLEALLERDIGVLIYVGVLDFVCNWVGNLQMTENLAWRNQASYNAQTLRDWEVDGKVTGSTKTFGNLTFASVFGAGHMVPYDQPKVALELLNRWISGQQL